MSKVELSGRQKAAVFAKNEPLYIKASAGSGKTRVLTERVRYLLNQTDKKVLALTFTNKAGEEIKERLKDIIDIEKRTFIGTFHGFCQSVLENHSSLLGYNQMPNIFEDDADRLALIEKAINQTPTYASNYKGKDPQQKKNYRYRVLNFISKVKRELIKESEDFNEDENVVLLYRNYQEILSSQNAIDFDDLLLLAYTLFTDYPKIAKIYQRSFFGICIDEAQDLNNAQYQLIVVITNNVFRNIMMVGDPNQSIYHFNGSSPDYMDKEFVADFSPHIIELVENYRSSIAVLNAAQKIIPEAEYIENTVKKGIFEIHAAINEKEEAKWVVDKIKQLISIGTHEDIENEITLEKITILARNKYVFKTLEGMLVKEKLPHYYKITPGSIKFESRLMQIFDLALRVKLNSQDEFHRTKLLRELNTSISDKPDPKLEDIAERIDEGNEKKIVKLTADLKHDGSNLKKKFDSFKNSLNISDSSDLKMVLNDIEELYNHWYNYAKKTDNKSLLQFKNAMALGQTHPLTQHQGITLSTIHSMKGQEYDIVFIIGMDDGTFPDYRAIRSGGIDMKQEKNNCYVAFTRSKRFLYVTWPEERLMPWGDIKSRRISRFLKPFNK